MKILLSTYIYVLIFAIIGFVSIEFLIMNRQTSFARSFHEVCIENIENSYFDPVVILDCKRKATELGYELEIKDCSDRLEQEVIPRYFITLEYKAVMPFFGISEDSTVQGYAS